jgi:uncharacterized protein YbaR (Trm112 family)
MPLQPLLLEVLADPVDHGPLLYFEGRDLLYNPRRRVAYAVTGAIPVMLPDEAREVGEEEHTALLADASSATETGAKHAGA